MMSESPNNADESSIGCGPVDVARDGFSDALASVNSDKLVYIEDVVRKKDGILLGVVTEVAGDSDSETESSDDDSDDDSLDDDDDEAEEAEMEEKTDPRDNAGDDYADGYDESKIRDNNKGDPLSPNQVRVVWMNDSETVSSLNDLVVVDRGFLHGDYVASESDQTGQVGIVVDVNIFVDLLAPDGSVLADESSKDLKRVRDITVGDYVVLGSWLGRVDDVLDDVYVLFDDGSMCIVERAEPLQLRPKSKPLFEDGHCPYYPGQRVRASSSSVFKFSKFLSGSWKANRLEGTVTKVGLGSVYVHWIASAGYGSESSSAPAEEQSSENLRLLSCFTHANWQLGDWCLLPSFPSLTANPRNKVRLKVRPQNESSSHTDCTMDDVVLDGTNEDHEALEVGVSDRKSCDHADGQSSSCGSSVTSVSVSKEPVHGNRHVRHKKLRKVVVKRDKKPHKKEETFERAFLIINTRTKVDVAWQDGKLEQGLKSTDLIPIESPGDHDFVAEQYVVEKGTDEIDDSSEIRRVGVVKSVNAKEKTACIAWLKPVARPEDAREFDKEETVSVYELEGHPDYDYCYGDVVVRLFPVSASVEIDNFSSLEEQGNTGSSTDVKENWSSSHIDINDASGEEVPVVFSDLSWVGNITGLKNGDIEVTWADGMVSTVGPQAIYVVGRDDDDDATVMLGSDRSDDDGASWETVEDDDMNTIGISEKELELPNLSNSNPEIGESNAGVDHAGRIGPLSLPMAAIGFVAKLATGIFSIGRKHQDSSESTLTAEEREHSQEGFYHFDSSTSSNQTISQGSNVIACDDAQTDHANLQEIDGDDATNLSNESDALCNLRTNESHGLPRHGDNDSGFKRFDTAQDPVDHFYLGSDLPSNNTRKWLKKMQQDWDILQNNLPDGIYVRVYEDRMDLLRAVIVGAYGTPYQDGLFFFDFHLLPDYPDVPPSAHYHSGGWRINPNLYEEGKVCLSLLNTWTGRGNEVWDPKSSSILQVLVSLQGLVLNSKPYFNEAGYDKQVGTAEGEKNSLSYNENTFLLNCKTMMYLIRRPPKDFEELVKEHFKRRGYYILGACDAYMKGYLIGSLSDDASITDKSDENATSVGFKLMLAKIVPKLFSALRELGADCDEFKHLQQL